MTIANSKTWHNIFSTLVIDGHPPTKYIKNAIVVTDDNLTHVLSAKEFYLIVDGDCHPMIRQDEIVSCSCLLYTSPSPRD